MTECRIIPMDPADLPQDHPDYIPRVTTEKRNRVNRLKALGNAQYPLCAAVAYLILSREGDNDE